MAQPRKFKERLDSRVTVGSMYEWMYGNIKKFSSLCLSEGKLRYIADEQLMAYRTALILQPTAIFGKHHGIRPLLN